MTYTTEELRLMILRNLGTGHSHAITGEKLSKRIGVPTRQMRLVIRDLIHDGTPIVGSPNPPYGYYLAENLQEAEENIAVLRSYCKEQYWRYKDFKRAAKSLLNPYQMEMRL